MNANACLKIVIFLLNCDVGLRLGIIRFTAGCYISSRRFVASVVTPIFVAGRWLGIIRLTAVCYKAHYYGLCNSVRQ